MTQDRKCFWGGNEGEYRKEGMGSQCVVACTERREEEIQERVANWAYLQIAAYSFSERRHNTARSSGETGPPEAANEGNLPLLLLAQCGLRPKSMLMHCEHKISCKKPCQGLAVRCGSHWFASTHFEVFRTLHWLRFLTYAPASPVTLATKRNDPRREHSMRTSEFPSEGL